MTAIRSRLGFILFGVLFAAASYRGETLLALVLTIVACCALAFNARLSRTPKRDFFLAGVVFSALAFYWLPYTITYFGGFPPVIAYLLFALYCLVSALQFLLCGWLYQRFARGGLNGALLALPCAWLISELVVPRLFPWCLAHPTVAWTSVAGIAEYIGVYPISALYLWWAEAIVESGLQLRGGRPRKRAVLASAAVVLVVVLAFGTYRSAVVSESLAGAPKVRAGIVQGNLEAKEKGDVRLLDVNLERYRALTVGLFAEGAQVVFWPESVLNAWTPGELENVRKTEVDPFPQSSAPLVYGGLSYRMRSAKELEALHARRGKPSTAHERERLQYHRFNSAIAIDRAGNITGRYHKRVLMPFGEYMPFADFVPMLSAISPHTGDFSVGDVTAPLPVKLETSGVAAKIDLRVGALICYEDLVPELSRGMIREGANLLVNLTNDAWYGDTAAPYQHHLLALWRAIETRRYLLRVTNTGYTAVVDPFGKTIASLPLFTDGAFIAEVSLLDAVTTYSSIGDAPTITICALSLFWLFVQRLFKKKEAELAALSRNQA